MSTGQADVLPIDAGVTMSTLQRTQADKDGFENPLGFLAGKFDPSFVLVYLLPLVILALSFNVLSGERESGTLHLLLSNPLGLARLISAKMTAQMAIIYLITSTVIAAGLAIAGGIYQEDLGLRIGLTLVIVFGYSLFWFALASMVNVLGHSSATNAVVCSAMWLLFVLIAPTLINVAVSAVYPVPSRNETISAAREINLDTRRDGSRLLAEHYQDHPEMMPKEGKANLNDFGLAFVLIQSEQKKKVDAVEDRFSAQLARQQELVTRLRFLSPSIVAQEAANDIAGTGLDRYQRFRKQVKEFDQTWSNFFAPRIYRQEQLTTADFEQIPRFRFDEESDRSLAVRVGGSALFLLLISGTLFGIASNRMAVYRFDQ
ncbi:MAG: DUF3526 domain-containing protein [Acidobacteria bacterium]|nr:DUF3526 domain-containing protein [Acidobacteriota bacterium]